MPLLRGTRPLKRWRWVGVFGEQLMACAALVQVGPARQSFWALHLPGAGPMRERTRMLPRAAELQLTPGDAVRGAPGTLAIRDRGVELLLALHEEAGLQARCPHGRYDVWTRKQAGVRASGTLRIDGGEVRAVEALAVIDDSAGHHARETEWYWSAGVGVGRGGEPLAWNLVSGINDPLTGSERGVWRAGIAHECPPVSFAPDLSSIACEDGSLVSFRSQGERSRRENLIIVRSDYRAPFGTFSGELPGHIDLAHGLGVVEHHRARW